MLKEMRAFLGTGSTCGVVYDYRARMITIIAIDLTLSY